MYPNLTAMTSIAEKSKTFALPSKPTFDGDQFKVFWDDGIDYTAVSTYTADSSLSDMVHTYQDYGEHAIKFSANVKSLRLKNYFERVKEIHSRSQAF